MYTISVRNISFVFKFFIFKQNKSPSTKYIYRASKTLFFSVKQTEKIKRYWTYGKEDILRSNCCLIFLQSSIVVLHLTASKDTIKQAFKQFLEKSVRNSWKLFGLSWKLLFPKNIFYDKMPVS